MMLNLLTMLQKETWNLCQILGIHITLNLFGITNVKFMGGRKMNYN